MARYFGKTWWGEKWLGALQNIDYSNRLPRGSAYAKNGKVKEMTISGGSVNAKVQGSYGYPYKVRLKMKLIEREKTDRLIDEIVKRPALLSKLIGRELDPEILSICQFLGIEIFPRSWKSMHMSCSCPDWAVPCKHIAATIYLLSKEIDNNPFLVFTIHGIDLLEELQKRGINIEVAEDMAPQKLDALLDEKNDESITHHGNKTSQTVSVTNIPDLETPLVNILPPNPPFYDGSNFTAKYDTILKKIAQKARRIVDGKKSWEDFIAFRTEIDRFTDVSIIVSSDFDINVYVGKDDVEPSSLIPSILAISPGRIDQYSPTVTTAQHAIFLATHLLAKGAVTPRIVELHKGGYSIVWHPAMIDKNVAKCVTQLQEMMPEEMIMWKRPKQRKPQIIAQSAYWLLTALLTDMVNLLTNVTNDVIINFFFRKCYKTFESIGYQEMAGNIRTWLDRYYLNADYMKLLLQVDDEDTHFDISLYMTDGKTTYPVKDIFQNEEVRMKTTVMRKAAMLYNVVPGLERYINQKAKDSINIMREDFADFIFNSIPVINLLGIDVMLPKSLAQLIRPKVTGSVTKKSVDKGTLRIDDLLDFDWQVALGDTIISPEEFYKLTANAAGLIKYKGRYIYASKEDLEKLRKILQQPPKLSSAHILQTALAGEYNGAKVQISDEVKAMIKQFVTEDAIPMPHGLKATLRPYQERGYSWMYRNMKLGFGSLIADDMGLGKTLQVIALLLKIKEDGCLEKEKVAIVVPTGLITNWENELNRFAPSLTYHTYHGVERDITRFAEDILLTSYGVLRSDHELLEKIKWYAVVIDEAQNIKNSDTAQSKAVKVLHAKTHIAMSGTPVENRLSEYWSIMDFANHGLLGTAKKFDDDFAKRIQRYNDVECAQRLKRITAPFIMRRLKSDKTIISDLPDKIERDELAILQPEQAALYHQTVEEAMTVLEGINAEDSKSMFKRTGIILQMITALKQICNHPALFLKNANHDVQLSGKTIMLTDTLRSIVESKEKVLVFTQFAEMGKILCDMVEEHLGERPLFYHGGLSLKQRKELVEQFQNDTRRQIFILTLKSAGTGLNLTAATHVIHFDLWWNPAVEAQATDRAYRIGQHSNVQVHRFITRNTFEEKINLMIQDKKHLAEMTVSTGENWIGKLSNEELRDMFC